MYCANVLTYALLEYDVDGTDCNAIGYNVIGPARSIQHKQTVHTIFSGRMHARLLTAYWNLTRDIG